MRKRLSGYCLLIIIASFSQQLDSQTTYKVGDGQSYTSIGSVPWENLVAGDSVKIYWRSTPYKEKWVINAAGLQDKWITITGIPASSGQLPIIDGQDATTRSQLNYWNEERGVIKIGGSNSPPDGMPAYIRVENLEIRNGRSIYSFTGRSGITTYSSNAAAIYLEKGENIVNGLQNLIQDGKLGTEDTMLANLFLDDLLDALYGDPATFLIEYQIDT